MHTYALLANPGHNRIYFESAMEIGQLELAAILSRNGVSPKISVMTDSALPGAILIETQQPLEEAELTAIAASSLTYAFFEIAGEDLLRPIKLPPFECFPESLNQILRYTGKTNEQFTRLMVNLAINACSTDSEKKTLLDPMCGKGTTLFEGIIRGMNVVGTEVQSASFTDLQAFLIKYLKTGRFKHRIRREKRSDSNGKKFADFFYVETAATKEAFAEDNKLTLQVYCADTRRLPELVKKQSCDMLVCDLPYGVQHGSKTASTGRLSRSPAELLEDSIAGWVNSMKSGASIVLSFNEFTLKWDVAKEILENAGLTVKAEAPFAGYLHRVDQSINRNIICAVKP